MKNEGLHLESGVKWLEKKAWIRNHESQSQFVVTYVNLGNLLGVSLPQTARLTMIN